MCKEKNESIDGGSILCVKSLSGKMLFSPLGQFIIESLLIFSIQKIEFIWVWDIDRRRRFALLIFLLFFCVERKLFSWKVKAVQACKNVKRFTKATLDTRTKSVVCLLLENSHPPDQGFCFIAFIIEFLFFHFCLSFRFNVVHLFRDKWFLLFTSFGLNWTIKPKANDWTNVSPISVYVK